mmetsp:Transcript_174958/g.561048  ORF Transcript_174958/g.561048 Transcript_174958/m.561048 type:complete len:93 (+) Transcript_174958:1911-2189(+)
MLVLTRLFVALRRTSRDARFDSGPDETTTSSIIVPRVADFCSLALLLRELQRREAAERLIAHKCSSPLPLLGLSVDWHVFPTEGMMLRATHR